MLKGLTHIAVGVRDLEKSLAFYKNIPGIEEQFRLRGESGATRLVYLRVGPHQFIELFPGSTGAYQATMNAGPVHFCLEVDDIQAMYREVEARGITPNQEPSLGADKAWQFWINDPDGNPIEFHQFTEGSMQLGG